MSLLTYSVTYFLSFSTSNLAFTNSSCYFLTSYLEPSRSLIYVATFSLRDSASLSLTYFYIEILSLSYFKESTFYVTFKLSCCNLVICYLRDSDSLARDCFKFDSDSATNLAYDYCKFSKSCFKVVTDYSLNFNC